MENQNSASLNVAEATRPMAFTTPSKTGAKTVRGAASAAKADSAKLFADSGSRPATAKKAERAPFSPVSMSESILSTVSESREAARLAKMKSENDRINKVAQLKMKWAQEKDRKTALYQERRTQELKKLQEDNSYAAELRRKNLEKQREIETKEKEAQKEQLAVSLKARTKLREDLDAESKAKRRISVFLNGQMRKRALAKEAELESKRKEEEKQLLESRRNDTLAVRQAKKMDEDRKRESMMGRTQRAQELRKKEEEIDLQRTLEQKSHLEMRYHNWQDDKSAKGDEERRRRESLSYRLDKWRAEKELAKSQKSEDRLAEEMNNELETQAREDIENYSTKQAEARRQSLSYRLDKARKDRDFELGQKALLQMVQEEERRIQEADREDMQQYKAQLLEARRQSMEYRSEIFKQEKMREQGERQAEQAERAKDFELRQLAWKDVQEHRAAQREQARKSIAWRLADAHRQQEAALTIHEEGLRNMHLDLLCRREDMLSKREADEEDAKRRRRSIQLRLQSWREVRMREEKLKERLEMEKEEDVMLREMDREELLAAKLTCELMQRRDATTSRMIH